MATFKETNNSSNVFVYVRRMRIVKNDDDDDDDEGERKARK